MSLSLAAAAAAVQLGWQRYKKAFCQERGASLFIPGTRFHSYINVVEVRRSGIPVSDLLHEPCSSPIDFHPTLRGGGRGRGWGGGGGYGSPPSRRYCGNNERAKRVGKAADKKGKEGREQEAPRAPVMTRPAPLRRSGDAVGAANREARRRPRLAANRCL